MASKHFDVIQLISVAHQRHIGSTGQGAWSGLSAVKEHLAGRWVEPLGRADEMSHYILTMHPQLSDVDFSVLEGRKFGDPEIAKWMAAQRQRFGATLPIVSIGEWTTALPHDTYQPVAPKRGLGTRILDAFAGLSLRQ